SLRGRAGARRNMVSEGFGAAMSLSRSADVAGGFARLPRPVPAGTTFTAKAVNGCSDDNQAAVQRKGSPVVHMRCNITASLRATAIVAFLLPMRLVSEWPQVCRSLGFADRLNKTVAASYSRLRTIPSPHFETRPVWSTSPDW